MARLTVKGTDTIIDVGSGQSVKIGRDASNEIPLPDEGKASRRHCQIMGVPSGNTVQFELTDLGATNKTRVNGKAVDRKVLSHGDVIQVGTVEILFEDESEAEAMRSAGSEGVCFIEWINKEKRGEKVWLRGPRSTFGRRESSTVPLDDRMASGHHAEIVKDLNGYTVRDLGSTNGTLVNGEPVTEAPLSHGTRIRIGNSRFVFKDPSMKDIEVELSQFDEDEGWGMMGDIDLSRAKRSWGGLIATVLMLAALGGGIWFFIKESNKTDDEGLSSEPANLVLDGTFDDDEGFAWLIDGDDEEEVVSIRRAKKGREGGGLSVSNRAEEGGAAFNVLYSERFAAIAAKPLRVKAWIRPSGGARFVAIWRKRPDTKAGATGVTHTVPIDNGSRVNALLVKPSWADDVAIGVHLPAGASARLDDVFVASEDGGPGTNDLGAPGDFAASLRNDGHADMVNNLTVLFAGAGPVARASDGTLLKDFRVDDVEGMSVKGKFVHGETELPATITWSKGGADGLDVSISAQGAAATGLQFGLPREHLAEGIDVLTSAGPKTMAAESGASEKGVSKLLAGSPRPQDGRPATLISVSPTDAAAEVALRDPVDSALLVATLLVPASSSTFHFVTDSRPLKEEASRRLSEAMALMRTDPGAGITALKAFATEFPFQEGMRDTAVQAAAKREAKAWEDVDALKESLRTFNIFRSADALADLQKRADELSVQFPSTEKGGAIAQQIVELRGETNIARREFLRRGAGADVGRLARTADMLKGVSGFEPMAALFYEVVIRKLSPLADDASFKSRLDEARAELNKLKTKHAEAIPPLPR